MGLLSGDTAVVRLKKFLNVKVGDLQARAQQLVPYLKSASDPKINTADKISHLKKGVMDAQARVKNANEVYGLLYVTLYRIILKHGEGANSQDGRILDVEAKIRRAAAKNDLAELKKLLVELEDIATFLSA